MSDVTITVKDNGPYIVQGDVSIVDAEGNEFNTDQKAIALCRCGSSGTMPFCNGNHRKIGFESEVRAAKE
ncbi:MAG: CDGSH iron-sulfur domain-containing protein [Pleurocapsa sp. MO_226.B13]|nr:CDGSH iron-sulfur domain-containing protein [Pleurocapsa sp. MO_226.B13]